MFFHSFCEGGRMLSYAVEGCLSKMHKMVEKDGKGGRKIGEKNTHRFSMGNIFIY